ncbi:MAG: penicillin acylase family protein, partial [Sphingomonas sp.]
ESGDTASPHFNDQIDRYASGALRPVYFYADDISAHAQKVYQPGR